MTERDLIPREHRVLPTSHLLPRHCCWRSSPWLPNCNCLVLYSVLLPLIDSSSFYAFKHSFPQGIAFDFGSLFKVFAHVFSQEMYTNTSCQILFQRWRWRDTGTTRAVSDINSGGLRFSAWPTCSVHLTSVPCLRAMLYPQLMEK